MDINDIGPYIPAIIGVAIGIWLFLKRSVQTRRCTSKAEGVITGVREIVTEGPDPAYDPNIHNSDNRKRDISWQATYSFETNGQTYVSAANKNVDPRFKKGDAVTVNYDPLNPSSSFIEQDRINSSTAWVVMAASIVISALFVIRAD